MSDSAENFLLLVKKIKKFLAEATSMGLFFSCSLASKTENSGAFIYFTINTFKYAKKREILHTISKKSFLELKAHL